MAGISRRGILCGLAGVLGIPQAATADATVIEFNADALRQILSWAQRTDATEPPRRRTQLPYELAREQAKWSGMANPDLEVERQLEAVREQKEKGTKDPLSGIAEFADRILQGRDEFQQWAVPHLRGYLPGGTAFGGTIVLAPFLPNYAFSMKDTIVVSVTDRYWGRDPARVFNLLVHELFHNGFIRHQRGASPADASDGAALLRALVWFVQNEGMATYVAYRARPAGLTLRDYALLENADEIRKRFDMARELIRGLSGATPRELPELRARMLREGNEGRVTYIVGAAMARRIEEVAGRAKLVETIERGPEAFVEAYRATAPETELTI